jgi:hypothetical protein
MPSSSHAPWPWSGPATGPDRWDRCWPATCLRAVSWGRSCRSILTRPRCARSRPTPRLGDLPQAPDLAVIATPAGTVPGLIADLGARGCRPAVVISAGFEGAAERCRGLRRAVLDAAKPHLMCALGPHRLGFIYPRRGINASFSHLTPEAGGLALVTQSGAIAAAVLDWAQPRGIGFSHRRRGGHRCGRPARPPGGGP